MFGDSFFTPQRRYSFRLTGQSFRPHVWGFFFHTVKMGIIVDTAFPFSSPCLGILFSQKIVSPVTSNVPFSFRPHVWGFFFHNYFKSDDKYMRIDRFSSPCLGILFSHNKECTFNAPYLWFSSPCLGILFSREKIESQRRNTMTSFRPHVWGFFFHKVGESDGAVMFTVFVPMFGDSFFTGVKVKMDGIPPFMFSSPCLGILFSLQPTPITAMW